MMTTPEIQMSASRNIAMHDDEWQGYHAQRWLVAAASIRYPAFFATGKEC